MRKWCNLVDTLGLEPSNWRFKSSLPHHVEVAQMVDAIGREPIQVKVRPLPSAPCGGGGMADTMDLKSVH